MSTYFEKMWEESPFTVRKIILKETYDYKKYIENYISTMKKIRGSEWSQ